MSRGAWTTKSWELLLLRKRKLREFDEGNLLVLHSTLHYSSLEIDFEKVVPWGTNSAPGH